MAIARGEGEGVAAVLPLRPSTHGVSASFLVRADDGIDYWCKAVDNPCSARLPVNEQVVARLAQAIGVAVPSPALVKLDGIAGWKLDKRRTVKPGWAHGCAAIEDAIETLVLGRREDDDNRVRHAGFYALTDWLVGDDPQWLYSTSAENAFYSHDHGHYFPGGPDWTAESLAAMGTKARELGIPPTGVDTDEIERLAEAIESTAKEEIDGVMSKIPEQWPVTDGQLAALSDFIDMRRGPVAARLRGLLTLA